MNTPTPANSIDLLISRLVEIQTTERPNEIELRRLQHKATTLLPSDTGDARLALGMIASLRGNAAEAKNQFLEALRCGRTEARLLNYAAFLGKAHRPQEALDVLESAIARGPGVWYLTALERAAGFANLAGRLHHGDSLMALREMQGALSDSLREQRDHAAALVATADALGLTDESMAAIHEAAWTIIREGDPKIRC